MLAGNVVALLSPLIYIPILTYTFGPQNYNYVSMAAIRLGDDTSIAEDAHTDVELIPGASSVSASQLATEQTQLARSSVIAKTLTAVMTLVLLILWPMPLYGTGYVFSKRFFTGWVSVGIFWLGCSALTVGVYPLWEGWGSVRHTFGGIWKDLRGGKGGVIQGRRVEGAEEGEVMDGNVEEDGEKAAGVVVEKRDSS